MARTHSKTIQFDRIDFDELAAYRALDKIGREALKKIAGADRVLDVGSLIDTREGIKVDCETLDEALAEAREEALTPKSFDTLMRVDTVGPYQIHITMYPGAKKIIVDFSNEEAGVNEAIAARMEREINSLRAQAREARAVTRESLTRWFQRTWRDHTATTVITVVGGVIVIALVAWLRIQS